MGNGPSSDGFVASLLLSCPLWRDTFTLQSMLYLMTLTTIFAIALSGWYTIASYHVHYITDIKAGKRFSSEAVVEHKGIILQRKQIVQDPK